jgi:hypothetical protein
VFFAFVPRETDVARRADEFSVARLQGDVGNDAGATMLWRADTDRNAFKAFRPWIGCVVTAESRSNMVG